MSEFESSVTLDVLLDDSSLDSASDEIEEALQPDPITASVDTGGGLMADGGQSGDGGLSALDAAAGSLVEMAEERNDLLVELLEASEAQALETAKQGGGGGMGTLLGGAGLVGGVGTGAGGSGGAGVLASIFEAVGSRLPGIGGGTGIGFPAIGPELGRQADRLRRALGGDSLIPDDLGGGPGGVAMAALGPLTGAATSPLGGQGSGLFGESESRPKSENVPKKQFDWPEPPDPFKNLDPKNWPKPPNPLKDLGPDSWPNPPDPFKNLGPRNWPKPPNPLENLGPRNWPKPPNPLENLGPRNWPKPPNPFKNLGINNWPKPPNPFKALTPNDWPDPPNPLDALSPNDWPDLPPLDFDINLSIDNLRRQIERIVKQTIRSEFNL